MIQPFDIQSFYPTSYSDCHLYKDIHQLACNYSTLHTQFWDLQKLFQKTFLLLWWLCMQRKHQLQRLQPFSTFWLKLLSLNLLSLNLLSLNLLSKNLLSLNLLSLNLLSLNLLRKNNGLNPSITDWVHRNENFVEIIPVFSTFSNFFKKKRKKKYESHFM